MSHVPEDLQYTDSHEWIRTGEDCVTVGITDHAQAELTDVVYVDLPKVGDTFQAGDTLCVVESVKAASDIYAPLSGEVVEANAALESNPALLNTDPYGEGWIFKLRLTDPGQTAALLSAADYAGRV